jgi:hypothetical protein
VNGTSFTTEKRSNEEERKISLSPWFFVTSFLRVKLVPLPPAAPGVRRSPMADFTFLENVWRDRTH